MAEAQLYPGARWTPLGMQSQPRMRSHDILCYHTMVGYLVSTDRYFRISNGEGFRGTESHYGVGGKWGPDLGGDLDGSVYQWQDRAFSADANLDGSTTVISVETADNAAAPIQPWTARQLDALVDIGWWECSAAAHKRCPESWVCHREGIPPVLIPDTKPGRRGIGYHRQGCPPNIVAGGVAWSRANGKGCPDPARIGQLTSLVIPRIRAALTDQQPLKPPDKPDPEPLPSLEELATMHVLGVHDVQDPANPAVRHSYMYVLSEPEGRIVAHSLPGGTGQANYIAESLAAATGRPVPRRKDIGTDWADPTFADIDFGPLAPDTPSS